MRDSANILVLKLNSLFQPIEVISAHKAFSDMSAGAVEALDMELGYYRRTPLAEWLRLPVRPGDEAIGTTRGPVRVPRVVVTVNYKKTRVHKPKLTQPALRKHTGDRCAYTGVKLTAKTFSREHVNPLSKGGRDEWTNVVAAHKDVNSARGNRGLKEAGLTLLYQPSAPKPRLPGDLIVNPGIPEWSAFLKT